MTGDWFGETDSDQHRQPDHRSDEEAYDADEEQLQDELDELHTGSEEDARAPIQADEVETEDIEARGAEGGQLEDNQLLDNIDAGEDEDREEVEDNQEQEFLVDQSRQPARGDVVAYVEGNYWVKARIRSKVTGYPHYYNIVLEDGRQDGAYFMPPTADRVESWTLLNEEDWNDPDREHLLDEGFSIPSRQVTPETTPEQERAVDDLLPRVSHNYEEELNLPLNPEQQLQHGRVHVLPLLHNPLPPYRPIDHNHRIVIHWPEGTDPTYAERVEAVATAAAYPPQQEHLRVPLAMSQVRYEMHKENNSVLAKIKRTFKKKRK